MIIKTNIKPSKNWDFKELIKYILTQYYDHDNVTLCISYDNKVCDHYSTDNIKIDALLDKTNVEHTYNLVLREYSNMKQIIPHEMVHLHQYETGDLKIHKFDNDIAFEYKGVEYDASTPYKDRPWEKEAHDLDNKLYKNFKKYVKMA